MLKKVCTLSLAALIGVSSPAAAESWYETEGARIRLVTAAAPDAEGVLRGALQIDLKPGWKTYWRDPGSSGVPPTVSVIDNENVGDPELVFPAPTVFSDGYSEFAGYGWPVLLALNFPVADSAGDFDFTASVFLGVCETICVPVQASFEARPSRTTTEHERAVAVAFDALPEAEQKGFRALFVGSGPEAFMVEAEVPEGTGEVELYVAGDEHIVLGLAEPAGKAGAWRFSVPRLGDRGDGATHSVHYTLVADGRSVSGLLHLRD